MRLNRSLLFPFALLGLAACSGKTTPAGTTSTPCTETASCPDAAAAADLSGTWDLVDMTAGGDPATGTLTLASNVFVLSVGGSVLSYTAQNGALTVSYTSNGTGDAPIAATRVAAPFSGGIVPVDIGGGWIFANPNDSTQSCSINVNASQIGGSCDDYIDGWPDILGYPTPGITYIAQKASPGTSQFGDLSGTWILSQSNDSAGACTVSFLGSTISAICANDGDTLGGGGSATLTFDGDSAASGSTSYGIEYSAHRR